MDEENTKDVQTEEQVTPEEVVAGKSSMLWVVAACLLIAGGAWYLTSKDTSEDALLLENAEVPTQTSGVSDDYPEVVATVNGTEVVKEEFVISYAQVEQAALAQGADITAPDVKAQIEEQALEVLINTVALAQLSEEAGIAADEAAVQAEFDAIAAQYESAEALEAALAENNLTAEMVQEDIAQRIQIDTYLQTVIDFESLAVTEEEVVAFYDSLASQGSGLPPVEEVSDAISQQLLQQKQQEAIGVYLDTVREEAEIEIHIEA